MLTLHNDKHPQLGFVYPCLRLPSGELCHILYGMPVLRPSNIHEFMNHLKLTVPEKRKYRTLSLTMTLPLNTTCPGVAAVSSGKGVSSFLLMPSFRFLTSHACVILVFTLDVVSSRLRVIPSRGRQQQGKPYRRPWQLPGKLLSV